MILTERDLALVERKRTRQLWAETYLGTPLSLEERGCSQWYDYLHEEVEKGLRASVRQAIDLRPASPEEALSETYRVRLMLELGQPGYKIGACISRDGAIVRIPLICSKINKAGGKELVLYLLEATPLPNFRDGRCVPGIVFAHMKVAFVEEQVKPGFRVLIPKILKPTLTGTPRQPLVTRLRDARKMKAYGWQSYDAVRDREHLISRAIDEANLVLSDPLNPPDKGRIFKSLDLELLPIEDHPRYLSAGNDDYRCNFDTFRAWSGKAHAPRAKEDKAFRKIQDTCFAQGAEAVRQVDNPQDWFITSERILACSVAVIPLAQYLDTPFTPLAVVFNWMKGTQLCNANFRLGDFKLGGGGCAYLAEDPVSERLAKFLKWAKHKREFVEISSSKEADMFGHRWSTRVRLYQDVILGSYFNPTLDGLSLKEQAARMGFNIQEPELPNKAAVYLDLAARINRNSPAEEIDTDPRLQVIYAQLSRQNQWVFKLADVVAARCRAAQTIGEEQFKTLGGSCDDTGTYLLFPQGVLERLVSGSRV